MKRSEFLGSMAVFLGLPCLGQRRPLSDNPAHILRDIFIHTGHEVDEASFHEMANYYDETVTVSTGSFADDGWAVGDPVKVSGSLESDGNYTIATVAPVRLTPSTP